VASVDEGLTCRVTARDFLLGSVWEGTGDEMHTNRHAARAGMFGARILSGITGMLVTMATYRRELVWETPAALEWAFAAPLFEGSELAVSGVEIDGGHHVVATTGDGEATRGRIWAGAVGEERVVEGTLTRGRTITEADVDLFGDWLGPSVARGDGLVPWPLLVLVASGLVNRTHYLGDPEMVLNRWFRWSFAEPPEVEDTVHCVIGEVHTRQSAKRPDLRVGEFTASLVSSPTDRVLATVEWVVIFR
jgi:hypothetical protein